MKNFVVYTKNGCPFCDKAKALLTQRGYNYTEHVVGNDVIKEDIQKRINALGVTFEVKTVPQIFYIKDGIEQHIGGFDSLSARIDNLN